MKPIIHQWLRQLPRMLLLVLLAATALPLTARDFTYDGITYTVISETEKTCKTKEGSSYYGTKPGNKVSGELILPEHPMDGDVEFTLTEIGSYGFCNCPEITIVQIPSPVKYIGEDAFFNCTGIESVELPSTVTDIGHDAFSFCEKLKHITIPSTVTTIGFEAFSHCYALTNITIPESLTRIEFNTFYNCLSLTSIIIPEYVTGIGDKSFYGCINLASVIIPPSVTEIGNDAFSGCRNLKKCAYPSNLPDPFSQLSAYAICYPSDDCLFEDDCIYDKAKKTLYYVPTAFKGHFSLPETITKINDYAFAYCSGLTSIVIPPTVTTIGAKAFDGCSLMKGAYPSSISNPFYSNGIKYPVDDYLCEEECIYDKAKKTLYYVPIKFDGKFTIPNSVSKIVHHAFACCDQITEVNMPNSITSVGENAFRNCSSLKSLEIPPSVTEIYNTTFAENTLQPLRLNSMLPVERSQWNFYLLSNSTIECVYGDLERVNTENGVTKKAWNQYKYNCTVLMHGLKIKPVENADYDKSIILTKTEAIIYYAEKEVTRISLDNKSDNIIKNLGCNSQYDYLIIAYDESGNEYRLQAGNFKTVKAEISFSITSSTTQTSITIKNVEAQLKNDESIETEEIGVIRNGVKYPYPFEGGNLKFNDLMPDESHYFTPYLITTAGETVTGSKYISTNGWSFGCTKDVSPTATVLKASFTEDDAKAEDYWWTFDGQRVSNKNMTLLSLAPNTSYSPVFHIYYKGKDYTFTNSVKTKELEFTTLQPKGVSATCAIVAAETNISDVEPLVGFQWKKYDAPSSLAPSEGYAAVCDGVLEGYIKNLQSTSYYNVRPFYKDAQGKYYYGEWVTFDPSDFSFFEPTVRTYPVQEVTQNSATVRGYALSGTENIKSQGFQYWKSQAQSHGPARVPSASEIMTVNATGQVMTATFDNLEAGATYAYRAFVETESGFTYGDEQSFTTEAVDGVGYVRPADVTVTGYYTLTGVRYDSPRPGLNIVVYSDGTTKKIFVR